MTFEQMIEARANHMFAGKNRTQDELDAARDVILLEYFTRNETAVVALMEGRAAVVPATCLMDIQHRLRLDTPETPIPQGGTDG